MKRKYKTKIYFLLHRVDSNQDELEVALQLIKERKLKGIIFLGGCFSHDEKRLKQINVPFVLSTISIFDGVDKNIYSSVSVDDIKEVRKPWIVYVIMAMKKLLF